MKYKAILSIAVALMISSVGCFAALGSDDSNAVSDGSPALASQENEAEIQSESALESMDYVSIIMPVYDAETDTFSTTDFEEVRMYLPSTDSTAVNGGGVDKVEKIRYYAQTSSLGFTEHYDGYKIYMSSTTLHLIATGAITAGAVLSGGLLSAAVIHVIDLALEAIGIVAIEELYPNGIIFVVATGIYITSSTTIPLVTLLHTESQ